MIENPVLDTDAYKITHWMQRPSNMTYFYNYGEPRIGGEHKEIMFFGLQYIIKEYLMKSITKDDIENGERVCKNLFGVDHYFPKDIWEKVRELGYFPIKIRAVKEGTVLPVGNVCFTCESTKDWFAPMISHFEDYLMWVWYSTAIATRGFNMKLNLYKSFKKSADNLNTDYAINDFGLRGSMFKEAAVLGGMAHLINFMGTDNIPAIYNMEHYYNCKNEYIGGSVLATEHSVATVWGKSREKEYVLNQLKKAGDKATVSIVIDSYDADNFIKNVMNLPEIKEAVINRSGRTVLRPDSGDPLNNMVKYSEILGNIYGYHFNSKEYKVLNNNVGLIQGDGMDENSLPKLYEEYIKTGWSAENIITGSGGGLLTNVTRDTDRWAIKVSYVEIDGKSINVQKTPKTDPTKNSKSGILKLHKSGNSFQTISSSEDGLDNHYTDSMDTVFENGKIVREQSLDEIKKIANSYFNIYKEK